MLDRIRNNWNSHTLTWNVTCTTSLENSSVVSYKVTIISTIWISHYTAIDLSKRNEDVNLHKACTQIFTALFIVDKTGNNTVVYQQVNGLWWRCTAFLSIHLLIDICAVSADAKSWLIGKDPAAGKDWGQGEKGATEDEMVGWHHWLSAHEFEQTLGDSGGQGSLVCCSSWGHKESGTT